MSIFSNIIHRFWSFEELPDLGLVEKRHAEDAKHIKGASIKFEVMLNNSNKAIGSNCRVNLDSDRIFGYTPERLYMQMLLNPLKEQFHLPSVFVKQRNIFRTDSKVVSKISEGSFMFHRVISDTPEQCRVFFHCLLSSKPYHLIVENVIRVFKKFLTFNDFILKLSSFSYYEVGANKIDCKESCKIKISPVKDVVGIRFVRNLIHGIHVMDFGLGNMKKVRDLCNYIIEGVYLDTTFGLSKTCPPKKVQAQVNSSRIKSIKPAANLKLSCNSFTLSDGISFYMQIPQRSCSPCSHLLWQDCCVLSQTCQTQDGRTLEHVQYYADKLPKTFTSGQLPIHHYQQLIPATKRFYVFISLIFHNNTLKCFLWEKFYQLCKNIFSAVHRQILLFHSKVKIQVVDMCFLRYYASLQFVIRVE